MKTPYAYGTGTCTCEANLKAGGGAKVGGFCVTGLNVAGLKFVGPIGVWAV